jgi:hypothetical protein
MKEENCNYAICRGNLYGCPNVGAHCNTSLQKPKQLNKKVLKKSLNRKPEMPVISIFLFLKQKTDSFSFDKIFYKSLYNKGSPPTQVFINVDITMISVFFRAFFSKKLDNFFNRVILLHFLKKLTYYIIIKRRRKRQGKNPSVVS